MTSVGLTLCFFSLHLLTLISASEIVVKFSIPEEKESSKAFGNIAEKIAPFLDSNATDLRYYMTDSQYKSMFSVNDVTGEIFTTIVIDRETVCKFQTICRLDFPVYVFESENQTIYKVVPVQIFIEDKNDNAPMFAEEKVTRNVSEGTFVGSTIQIPTATDNDTGGNNSIQNYELVQNSDIKGVFNLTVNKTSSGTFRVNLVVNKILDRESKDSYNVRIIAKDGGIPANTGTLLVNIQVQDTNDNQPEFSQHLYNISVKESTAIDETILVLSANDKDIGKNGRITYRIKEFQKDKDLLDEIFRLNELTGELKIKSELTSRAGNSYRFIVEALDHGDEPYVTEGEVLVHIEDSGNNAPIVTVGFFSPGNKQFVNIFENTNKGAVVAHVNIEDTDTGSNGNVSCRISDNHFEIQDKEGKEFVVVNSVLDREVKNVYNLTVTCSDQGLPVMSGSSSFLVHILDLNDNKPVFDSATYSAKISENNKGNEMILQVSASDKDLNENAKIVYDIHEDAEGQFVIDRTTGVVSVNTVFDREEAPIVIFHVLAIDNGKTALTGTATVSLIIEDKNDNAPVFTKPVHGFSIPENQPTGTNVATLAATDDDTGLNAEFDFSIAPEYINKVPFILFSNGVLKANQQLDREERSRYDFVAIVKDHGDAQLSSLTHVTITVDDRNDNAPIFTFPDPSNYSVTVLYPDYESEYIATVKAYDLDEGKNKEITYSIKSGDDLGILKVNQESGDIMFKNKIDIAADKTLELEVAALDKGDISMETVKTLFIELKYTNATFLERKDRSENSKHIIISVVVVIVTIVISCIILGIILFLRARDKKKQFKAEEPLSMDLDFGFHGLTQSHMIISPDTLSAGSAEGRDPIKKKEVSFILDTSDSLDCQHEMQNMSAGSSYSRSKPLKSLQYSSPSDSGLDVRDLQKEANVQLQSMKLQQMILQNRAKQWVQTQQQQYGLPPHDDHHSEGSSETIGSDSGRGCSEEDDVFSTPSADDPKLFDVSSPESQRCHPPPPSDAYTRREIHRTSSYVKKPWTRKPHLATKDLKTSQTVLSLNKNLYRSTNIVHSDELRSNVSTVGQSRMSWGSAYQGGVFSPMDFTGDSTLHSFFSKTPVCVLRDEDDNCSTTTSGSYTIQSEEIL